MSDLSEINDPEKIKAQVKKLAWRIREEREKARISQMELSFRAGLSQNQIFCIETGRRTPNVNTMLKICSALGINPATLFLPSEEEKRKARETVISLITRYM